jgi:hypothetical protein
MSNKNLTQDKKIIIEITIPENFYKDKLELIDFCEKPFQIDSRDEVFTKDVAALLSCIAYKFSDKNKYDQWVKKIISELYDEFIEKVLGN